MGQSDATRRYDRYAAASHIWTTRGKDHLALLDPVANQMLTDALQDWIM
jgi:hypothetical protein